MNQPNPKPSQPSLTAALRALLISGAVALGISSAAAAAAPTASGNDLQSRLKRVRQQLDETSTPALHPGQGEGSASGMNRFWRNWGNGGWRPRRWGNGWPNWPNWNNWRNGGPSIWANF